MKLYPKQLNSLQELKQEKKRLEDAAQSYREALSGKEDNSGLSLTGVMDMLNSDNPVVASLISLLTRKGLAAGEKFAVKRLAVKLLKEVAGGYAKWKLLELGIKTGIKLWKKAKAKHTEEKKTP